MCAHEDSPRFHSSRAASGANSSKSSFNCSLNLDSLTRHLADTAAHFALMTYTHGLVELLQLRLECVWVFLGSPKALRKEKGWRASQPEVISAPCSRVKLSRVPSSRPPMTAPWTGGGAVSVLPPCPCPHLGCATPAPLLSSLETLPAGVLSPSAVRTVRSKD